MAVLTEGDRTHARVYMDLRGTIAPTPVYMAYFALAVFLVASHFSVKPSV